MENHIVYFNVNELNGHFQQLCSITSGYLNSGQSSKGASVDGEILQYVNLCVHRNYGIYMYIYIYNNNCTNISTYVTYIMLSIFTYTCIYIYIYIYTHIITRGECLYSVDGFGVKTEIQDVASLLKSSSAGVSFSDWVVQAQGVFHGGNPAVAAKVCLI